MPIPHQEDQHGRNLTSIDTPTPVELKNELCQIQKYRLKLKNGQLTIMEPSHYPSPYTTIAILHLPNYTASSQIKKSNLWPAYHHIPTSMPIPHLEDQHGLSLTSNVTPTSMKLKNELCQIKNTVENSKMGN
jgi:ubiquitin